jgi:hypothetical protein
VPIQFTGWKSYASFFSADYCQRYLYNKYKKQNLDNPEQKSYENCYAFLYFLEHGQIYYEQAEKSPLILKPILLFYGFVHLIKACILSADPNYPESTSVLAHGVSTRKRKKQNYQFFQDEVKFQKNGLFPFISEKLFQMKHLEGDKASMDVLLQLVPELDDLFALIEGKNTFIQINTHQDHMAVPESILDHYHMTEARFKEFIASKSSNQIEFSGVGLQFQLPLKSQSLCSPIKYNLETDSYVLPLKKDEFFLFPELMIHYLLLYNLSMIARYETEWWSELTKMMPNKDYPFIKSFLDITQQKGPYLVYQYLMDI